MMNPTAALRLAVPALLLLGAPGGDAVAQEPPAEAARIVSSEIVLSRDEAEITLELADGRDLVLAVSRGRVRVDGDDVGEAERGGSLDRSWRQLLTGAMDAPTAELRRLLLAWEPPGSGPGERLDAAIEDALRNGAVPVPAPGAAPDAPAATARDDELPAYMADSVARLRERIEQLEERLARERDDFFGLDRDEIEEQVRAELERELGRQRDARTWFFSPLRHVGRGLMDILGTLATYAVLVGLGFAAVFFGRSYLEGAADTARYATVRSGLVGLAALFLLLPAFILGMVFLAISIVGIPLLLVWLPLFPLAAALALLFGYLAVGHAAGEALAERRFYGGDWFKRANSYYYVLTGLGLLMALFLASAVVEMGGPLLGWLRGLLLFLAFAVTAVAMAIGFGAVLLSRAGTRPVRNGAAAEPNGDAGGVIEEEAHV